MDNAAATEPKSVLCVSELSTAFRDQHRWIPVVQDLNFSLSAGETLAIVGESGSGKSVTALSIMGLLERRTSRVTGRILLNDQSLLELPAAGLRALRGNQMAMIFQEPMTSLNPVFSIGQQIAETLIYHRRLSADEARRQTLHLLDKVRIPNATARFDDYPHQFSGGMRQRVMIAMALALSPRLLIADEPTTALDVTIQGQILALIQSLQQETGMAVLFITHDMGVVAEIADRTLVMYQGVAAEQGDTARLFAQPRHAYTRRLLAAVPKLGAMNGQPGPLPFPIAVTQAEETQNHTPDNLRQGTPPAPPAARPDTATPLLSVKHLTARFPVYGGLLGRQTGAVHAVEDLSFDLYAGETLSLVGESGCGKSTTGRAITRLLQPDSGQIWLEGQDVMQLDSAGLRQLRTRIQMIFQDPFASLNPRMRIGDALIEPMRQHGIARGAAARAKAAMLLEKVGLSAQMMHRFPHEFSGGQRQRICIARALTLNPKVIVADESVSALDVSIKAQVVNLLLELQQSMGLAFVFISHDMAIVERISHRVAVMYLGEIVEMGPRAAVFGNPQHPYTRKLMAAVPIADPARRQRVRLTDSEELHNPVRPLNYQAPLRALLQVSPGHWVRQV